MLKLVKYQFKSNFKSLMIFLVATVVFQVLFVLRINSEMSSIGINSNGFNFSISNALELVDLIIILGIIVTSIIPIILFIQNCNSYDKMMKNYNLLLIPQKGVNYPLANLIYWTICLVVVGIIDFGFVAAVVGVLNKTGGYKEFIYILKLLLSPVGILVSINILIGISLCLMGILLSTTICTIKIANKSIHWIFGIVFFLAISKIFSLIIDFLDKNVTFGKISFNTNISYFNDLFIASGININNTLVTINLVTLTVKIIALILSIFAIGYIIDKRLEA
ncbi:MAG: hypothetical protein KID00_10730 [Clostridium argentinense]|uniref:hypothetical protein n=1 Tax=Clostridium butanoliproducens TaxID=2991837 RepID=UPI001DEC59AB|nr:hypothetical protein [Clostridium butanoliproducens]MBS5824312.1 hypothetical protein [Clostridium argentinense]MDU1349332.1 hypothetical protein [Clostridium argentinense]